MGQQADSSANVGMDGGAAAAGGVSHSGSVSSFGSRAKTISQAGARGIHKGAVTISKIVMRNPVAMQVVSCVIGLALSVCSVLSVFHLIGHNEEEGERWTPQENMQNFYVSIFGLIIFARDAPESLVNTCFNLQTRLFQYFYFLGTQPGRAFFYFYVGSITLAILPDSELWKIIFIILGGTLCILGFTMLMLRFFPCCRPET